MNYAYVKGNTIIPIELPTTYLLQDNREIIGFNNLPISELNNYGYYELIDNTLSFNDKLTYKSNPLYTFDSINNKVIVVYQLTDYTLSELKTKAIQLAYQKCADTLSKLTTGYSIPEIAKFPLLQEEILAYITDNNVIGPKMTEIINFGLYNASTLKDLLYPKIVAEQIAYQERSNKVIAINNAVNPTDLLPYL